MKTHLTIISLLLQQALFCAELKVDVLEKTQVEEGLMLLRKSLSGTVNSDFNYLLFQEDGFKLAIRTQSERKTALKMAVVLESMGAVAGCNGGYFEMRKFGPSGLQISGGVASGSLETGSTYNGVLMVRNNRLAITRADSLSGTQGVTELIQCSPVYVLEGKLIYSMPGDTLENARTFVATDGRGGWIIGTANKMTLSSLAALLINNAVVNEIQVKDAMNLDGGPSTGLWVNHAGKGRYVTEESTKVQNIVSIFRK